MLVTDPKQTELFDKLVQLAQGDPELVSEALSACAKYRKHRHGVFGLFRTYYKHSADLKDVVRYIQERRPPPKPNARANAAQKNPA